ncbi:MAG TPA: protein kinase, partial [Ktedonobacterales bacterium]
MDDQVMAQATFEGATIQRRYQLTHELARGATCAVYAGEDTNLRRPIAVKAVPPAQAAVYRAALLATATIAHPAAVMVLDAIAQDGWYFIIQEFVDGAPLAAELDRGLSSARAVSLGLQLTRLLIYAHQRGVVHGDVTPAAVLIERDGTARLNNFCLPPDLAYFAHYAEAQSRLGRESSGADGAGALAPVAPMELATPAGDLRAIGLLLWRALASAGPSGEVRDFRADVPAEVRDLVERMLVQGHPRALTSASDLLMTLEVANAALSQRRADEAQATPPAVREYRGYVARSAPWSEAETQLNGVPWTAAPGSGTPPGLAGPAYDAPRGGPIRAPMPAGPFDAPGLPGVPGAPGRYPLPLALGPVDTQLTVPTSLPLAPARPSGPMRAPGGSGPLRAPSPSG